MADAIPDPAAIAAPASYHWTPALQRDFLGRLATSGSVRIAAAHVSMSPSAAYQLRRRPEGAAFSLGWAAALLIARDRLADELLDRAIYGVEESVERQAEAETQRAFTKRRRQIPSLGLAMLARLDRAVDVRARAGEAMLAQIIAGDWAGFLSLFDIGAGHSDAQGHGAALACWLAGRDNRANPLASLWNDTPIANEVAQFSALSESDPEPEPTPEEEAAEMTIWADEETGEWRTNFPPPDDYVGIEEGQFGDENYERTLDAEEAEAWEAAHAEVIAPLRKAGEAARRAFFGLPDPANDAENDAEIEEEPTSHPHATAALDRHPVARAMPYSYQPNGRGVLGM
ncbi:hypothetical protein [Sphingopyxis sp.]|uniref:hypothetical protein n=1 Tax=Sphingopyxis sp. TaxID=1908224 RepID=UPI0010F5F13B|nr:hypothetical protein [Sphingopyxis sp.]MBR2174329.1 hypothetical protein [Sphingopyxis sp.]